MISAPSGSTSMPTQLSITCRCGKLLQPPDNIVGRVIKCTACGQGHTVPFPDPYRVAIAAAQRDEEAEIDELVRWHATRPRPLGKRAIDYLVSFVRKCFGVTRILVPRLIKWTAVLLVPCLVLAIIVAATVWVFSPRPRERLEQLTIAEQKEIYLEFHVNSADLTHRQSEMYFDLQRRGATEEDIRHLMKGEMQTIARQVAGRHQVTDHLVIECLRRGANVGWPEK